jgi:hypothetical protein
MPSRSFSFAIIIMASLVSSCGEPLTPPTPPLLEHVSTGRGAWWDGGCPPATEEQARINARTPEALSPELTDRLSRAFPAGSNAELLEHALVDQGFTIVRTPCRNAPTIHSAQFRQSGGGFYGPYPIFASVAWEVNAAGQLMWTKGNVSFSGP